MRSNLEESLRHIAAFGKILFFEIKSCNPCVHEFEFTRSHPDAALQVRIFDSHSRSFSIPPTCLPAVYFSKIPGQAAHDRVP